MMSESNETAIDMDSEDAASDNGLSGAHEHDEKEEEEEDIHDEEQRLAENSHRPWTFEYYQGFFDVDTDQVLSRIWRSFIPRGSFMSAIERKPDLYGPFWICMTLALSITISGNIAALFDSSGEYAWRYDFRHLSFAITAIYSYVWLVPCVLAAWLWWRGVKSKSATLFALTCVYGYSLAVFVPSSILFTIPNKALRWTFVMLAMVLSGAVLFRTFWPLMKKKDKKLAFPTLVVILVLHAALSVGFVLYFFPVVPSAGARTVAPLPHTLPALPATAAIPVKTGLPMPSSGKSMSSTKVKNASASSSIKKKHNIPFPPRAKLVNAANS